MSTNQTPNYGLCQWEAGDQVLRADFNADNAKLEAALSDLEKRVALLDRTVPNLAYYVGQLALLDFEKRQKIISSRSMTYFNFCTQTGLILTGGAVIQNGQLVLNGTGAKGSMTKANIALRQKGWSVARIWVHYSGGTVTASLNGAEMKLTNSDFGTSVSGVSGWEEEFTTTNGGSNVVTITLNLDCGTDDSMSVQDYCLILF